MKNRTSSNNITELKENEIFVFGSNGEGNHIGGAAKTAVEKFGAIMGQSEGLQGKSYGINTMSSIEVIKEQINRFIEFANTSDLVFLVTEIGCGIANFKVKDVAPLFESAKDVENIHLPKSFWDYLNENEVLVTYKAFDENFKCRDFQFEVGKEYECKGEIKACNNGFHSCENPLDVLDHYDLIGSKFAKVEVKGDLDKSEGNKVASRFIKVNVELKLSDFINASVEFIFGKWFKSTVDKTKNVLAASGYYSQLAASGDNSKLAASGNYSQLASTSKNNVLAAISKESKVKGINGNLVCLVQYDKYGLALSWITGKIGENGLEENVWYKVGENGGFEKCD